MKEYAITENHLFVKAYKKGRKSVKKTVVVYVLPDYKASKLKKENPRKMYLNRVGLTVSVKLGGAVERNRAKRIIRAAYRSINVENKLATGNLLVIVAREAAMKSNSRAVKADLTAAFAELGLFSDRRQKP